MSDKAQAQLENWYLIGGRLYGNVHHHPNFNDGELVRTSSVVIPDTDEPAKQGDTLETRNTFYYLGQPGKRHSDETDSESPGRE